MSGRFHLSRIVPSFWQARFVMVGGEGAATSVRWISGVEAFPSCLVVIATTTILYSVNGPEGEWDVNSLNTFCNHWQLTQFLERIIMNPRFTSHTVFGVVLRHRQMSLIERSVIDSINEIRSVRLFRLVPRDLYRRWGHLVNSHIPGMRWNCKIREWEWI